MKQRRIKAAFIRGGTSKGVFFRAGDLPAEAGERDAVLLRALGSPDPYVRQLDGLGGGISSLSKAVIVGRSAHPDADVDYTFAQVAVDRPVVDFAGTCGNLSSAVGPFAIEEGLIQAVDGEAVVRVLNTNTNKIFHARFQIEDGEAVIEGEQGIPGVAQLGAPVALEFLDPGGSMTTGLLPTGNVIDEIETTAGEFFRVSMVDATNPIIFIAAGDVGISARELPDALEADAAFMDLMDRIRRAGAVAMGLATSPDDASLNVPKIAAVAPPADFTDIQGLEVKAADMDVLARAISMERVHRALPLTLSMCLAAASHIGGSVVHQATVTDEVEPDGRKADVRIGNPSGVIVAGAEAVTTPGAGIGIERCRVLRTQRRLMEGFVTVPVATGRGGAQADGTASRAGESHAAKVEA